MSHLERAGVNRYVTMEITDYTARKSVMQVMQVMQESDPDVKESLPTNWYFVANNEVQMLRCRGCVFWPNVNADCAPS